jgi:hypothetical protein
MQKANSASDFSGRFAQISRGFQVSLQTIASQISEAFESIRPVLIEVTETLRKLPEDILEVSLALADRGWYVSADMDMAQMRQLQAAIQSNELSRLDDMMQALIIADVAEIEAVAVMRFPARSAILAAAFEAHRLRQYELSVPVLLIQIDGMCSETFGIKFYSANKGVPLTKRLAESISTSSIMDAFLSPLCRSTGLTAGERHRAGFPLALNRHEVLHGVDINYASLINSLKAISLLNYFVTWVVRDTPANKPFPLPTHASVV